MKSTLAEMMELPRFEKFIKHLQNTANYFVATNGADENKIHAIRLCIAEAFKEGIERKFGGIT